MQRQRICAIVVTFYPQASVPRSLAGVRLQVDDLVIVDNGSPGDAVESLRVSQSALSCVLIEHHDNIGIAAALNVGVRWAKEHGFAFVVLFDQDSEVTGGFVQAMLHTYHTHPLRDQVAIVTPSQVERNTGQTRAHGYARDGGPLVAITSGSLIPMTIFDRCGWFEEDLFIDCVDHEFCLRARSHGYTLAECREAVLLVSVGATTCRRAFGWNIRATHHSPKRRYYMTRNRFAMIKRFWRQEPKWCCRTLRDVLESTINLTFMENDPLRKLVYTGRGFVDGLFGRMGKVIDL